MAAPIFKTVITKDDHSNRVQQNITDAFNRLKQLISDGNSTLQTQITNMSKSIIVSGAQEIITNGSYSIPVGSGKYASVVWTGLDTTDAVNAVNIVTAGIQKGVPFLIGENFSLSAGTSSGVHFFVVEFSNS